MSDILTAIQLDSDYRKGAVERKIAYQQAASRYELEFERAYSKRLQRRAEDRKHFLEVVIPNIKREAVLKAYERSLAERNHAVVA